MKNCLKASLASEIGIITGFAKDGFIIRVELQDSGGVVAPQNRLLEDFLCQMEEYLEGRRERFSLPISHGCTGFRAKALEALASIPYGTTLSYATQAERAGNPKAYRAAALANAYNPLPLLLPCHRVINKNGRIGGYSGGGWRKEWLLKLEGVLQ